MDHYFSNPY
jgi:hypothetical protein